MRYDTVLWDIDNTLLDFTAAQRRGIIESMKRFGRQADDAQVALYARINQKYWEMLERGEVTKEQLEAERFREFLTAVGAEDVDVQELNEIYKEQLANEPVLIEGAQEICAALREMGVRQYAVTNGDPFIQRNKIKLSGLNGYFEELFISEELGAVKPKKEFFEKAAAQIPLYCAERTLIIGDSLTSDMRGGMNAGIDRCWYNPMRVPRTADFPIQYEIARLEDAAEIIRGK
ncbi:MAG: YjjG family noncanonical pyrimidine nucleotidase [Clostridium sp.]|nr:YjjG family noncanonical pyrimidine nucleotidase [Clostridium sp.]